jgi:hypothetical protein
MQQAGVVVLLVILEQVALAARQEQLGTSRMLVAAEGHLLHPSVVVAEVLLEARALVALARPTVEPALPEVAVVLQAVLVISMLMDPLAMHLAAAVAVARPRPAQQHLMQAARALRAKSALPTNYLPR